MFKGIVYRYVSPSGKSYIGQTINESKRKRTFNNINVRYAGGKIEQARLKYSPEKFKYFVEQEVESETKEELLNKLNNLEILYISKYNSFENWYNSTPGGDEGHKISEEERLKLSNILSFPIIQYDLNGNFIKIWKSCKDIELTLKFTRVPIQKCCRGITDYSNGFIWKYFNSEEFLFEIDGIKENKSNTRKESILTKQQSKTIIDGKVFKRILLYDILGNFIKEWNSIKDASKFYDVKPNSISQCCNGTSKTCAGYIWKFYINNYPLNIKVELTLSQILKAAKLSGTLRIYKYDLNKNLLKTYESIREAIIDNNIPRTTLITDCLSGRRKTCKNFIWEYGVELYKLIS